MSIEGLLPTHLAFRGRKALSVHWLDSKEKGQGLAGVLVSEAEGEAFRILQVTLLPWGDIPLERATVSEFPEVIHSSSEWLNPFFLFDKESISAASVYMSYSRSTARKLLTGHLLAVLYSEYLIDSSIDSRLDPKAPIGKQFKFNTPKNKPSLTKVTARNYRLLTEWLESSPLQALASFEGVRVVTIRNRLQAARDQGLIENPGPGKRSAKRS